MKNKLPLWKRIVKKILCPFVFCWLGLCWCIMKVGRGIYWFGNRLSGERLDPYIDVKDGNVTYFDMGKCVEDFKKAMEGGEEKQ